MMEPQKKTAKPREKTLGQPKEFKEPRKVIKRDRKLQEKLQEKQIKNLPEAEAARTDSPKNKESTTIVIRHGA